MTRYGRNGCGMERPARLLIRLSQAGNQTRHLLKRLPSHYDVYGGAALRRKLMRMTFLYDGNCYTLYDNAR